VFVGASAFGGENRPAVRLRNREFSPRAELGRRTVSLQLQSTLGEAPEMTTAEKN
jgi:hypothetical protein